MIIYPAVDIKDGKCVRLSQGDYEKTTVYGEEPVEAALKWYAQGAEYIHVVDLDGAKAGEPKNLHLADAIAKNVKVPVQLGGGLRSLEHIEMVLGKGIRRVILGTAAVTNPQFIKEALRLFQENIIIGIDAVEGKVAIEGWFKTTDYKAVELAKVMQDAGALGIIFTDISCDGMLKGPNLKSVEEIVSAVDIDIIVAGGISRIQDVKDVKNIGAAGIIIGKALYTGNVDLMEAISVAKS